MDSSIVYSAAIKRKQALARGRKKQAQAVLINFIVIMCNSVQVLERFTNMCNMSNVRNSTGS